MVKRQYKYKINIHTGIPILHNLFSFNRFKKTIPRIYRPIHNNKAIKYPILFTYQYRNLHRYYTKKIKTTQYIEWSFNKNYSTTTTPLGLIVIFIPSLT